MPLLNFQKRFVAAIESGDKTHTIRARRKHPIMKGQRLYLYTGLRQKGARKLLEAVCTKVEEIEISKKTGWPAQIFIEGMSLTVSEREQLAVRDGFDSWKEMLAFWDGRLPFVGQIIHWKVV